MSRSAEAQKLSLGIPGALAQGERASPAYSSGAFRRIDHRVRQRMYVEHGYAKRYGVDDGELAELVGGIWTREQLIGGCDVTLLPKVQAEDLAEMLVEQIIWGWPHCVQDTALTQVAIDRRLTLIAFDAMNHWQADGGFGLHVFHKNTALLDEEYFGRQTVDLTMLSLPKPQWVTTPLLVLGAECDACFSQDEIRATARAYGTEAEIFPDMGHNMMLEPGWAAVAERIHGWLGTRGLRGDDGRSGEQVASQ